MMGRKRGGYTNDEIAPLRELERPDLAGFTVTEAHMISARVIRTAKGTQVESYGEPVGVIATGPEHEGAIHQIGRQLGQWHYAIERGPRARSPGRTDFYETPWATAN